MAIRPDDRLIEDLRRIVLFGHDSTFSDGDLLGRFVQRRDDAAFEALMCRHGPMVFGVCNRVLHHRQDAEDAFQATFLVLARKASHIAPPEMLGNWLYGVAHQTAIRARTSIGKRNQREQQVPAMPETPILMAQRHDDLWRLLDQEVSRLPDKYRAPIVLCDLEGKTRQEAARHLGWPEGSVAGRLARGREMLAVRLAKHGPTLSVGVLTAELTQNAASACVSPSLITDTIKAASLFAAGQTAATGGISVQVAALAEGMIRIMNVTKLATTTLAILLVAGVVGGLGVGGYQLVQGGSPAPQTQAVAEGDKPPAKAKVNADTAQITDKERIVGVWRVKTGEIGGNFAPSANLAAQRFRFTKDGKYIDEQHSFEQITGPITSGYDLVGPGQIDLTLNAKVFYGIYRFDGDNRLTLCIRHDGEKTRPTEFATETGDRRAIMHLVRAKPGEESPTHEDLDMSRFAALQKRYGEKEFHSPASRSNLGEIGLAFHVYHSEHRSFPAHAIYSADGKTPLLSWRVAVLPSLRLKDLYDQFKLDEPWDSEHNKTLIPKMPYVYLSPVAGKRELGKTFYQVVTGPDTVFDGVKTMRIPDISDGASKTILAIEAKDPVIWTRPADIMLPADKDKRLPIGELFSNGVNALFCDGGKRRFLSATIPATTLRALVTPRGGEVVDIDSVTVPTKD